MNAKRRVYFVSDRTGITAEVMGRSLLTQFDHIEFERQVLPFIDTPERAAAVVEQINHAGRATGQRPIVFSTMTDPALRAVLAQADAFAVDFFDRLLAPLEAELGVPPSGAVGKAHGMGRDYPRRIEALNFALGHDDGLGTRLADADIVLLGVSRCGKTPTCLYLALNYGLHAANYPLTPDDLARDSLPRPLGELTAKLFGLSISAERLAQIREQRKPGSTYAAIDTCRRETRQAEALFRSHGIPYLDSTAMSIEEIAARIVNATGLARA